LLAVVRKCAFDVAEGPESFVQALFLMVGGVRIHPTGLRVKPSWDLPDGFS
jgi:hypothetical protein